MAGSLGRALARDARASHGAPGERAALWPAAARVPSGGGGFRPAKCLTHETIASA